MSALAATVPAGQWHRRELKEGSKGPMVADFAALRVVAVREGLPGPEVWLVCRRHVETGELKTSRCNAPAGTALATLARLSGMRWPSETCCEQGKQYLGMGDYASAELAGLASSYDAVYPGAFFPGQAATAFKKTLLA